MFDFFAILSKGGIVLWYIQNTPNSFVSSINALIKSVILSEHGGANPYIFNELALKYHMDNEFKLFFVVGYQKVLQLSYADKFISSLALEFRDRYRQDLYQLALWNFQRLNYTDFTDIYEKLLQDAETKAREESKASKKMRSFHESSKSKKTMASIILNGQDSNAKDIIVTTPPSAISPTNTTTAAQELPTKLVGKKNNKKVKYAGGNSAAEGDVNHMLDLSNLKTPLEEPHKGDAAASLLAAETIQKNKEKMMLRFGGRVPLKKKSTPSSVPVPDSPIGKTVRKGKQDTKWAGGAPSAAEIKTLDFNPEAHTKDIKESDARVLMDYRGMMQGQNQLREINVGGSESSDDDDNIDNEENAEPSTTAASGTSKDKKPANESSSGRGVFGIFRSLVSGSSTGKLTRDVMQPVLEQLRDRLIDKNVASEVAVKICEGLAVRLEGGQLGTFERVQSRVRASLVEACTQLLQPKRRVDVLRDVLEAKNQNRPYVIVFCGVNGVGKSTNLAKIAFWLIEQNLRVLIAAGDTFRAGAVEQLRVHVSKLNYIHPASEHGGQVMVELHERGYGKDAAGIAASGINRAREGKYDVVLVDTAGRMQDNQPLMQALSKVGKLLGESALCDT